MPSANSAPRARRPQVCQRSRANPPATNVKPQYPSGIHERHVSPSTSRCSKRSSNSRNAAPPTRNAAMRRSRCSRIMGFDDDLPGHFLVPAAAKNVAVKGEGPGLRRHDAHARDLAWLDVLVDLQVGDLEAVLAIER